MTSFWLESWTGANGSPWPAVWFTSGRGAATIEGNRGRLHSGTGVASSSRGRLVAMSAVRDVNLLLTFTMVNPGEQFLTVGVRTRSNDPLPGDDATSPRGMFVQINTVFGSVLQLMRYGYDTARTDLIGTSTGIPAITAGTAYKLRFLVEGKRLRTRYWLASGSEPSTWQLDYTDPDAYMEPGKVTIGFTTEVFTSGTTGPDKVIDFDDLQVLSLDAVELPLGEPIPQRVWTMWSRAADNTPDVALPIAAIKVLKKHMGVRKAIVETEYTAERWLSLQPSRGLLLNRNNVQEFSGPVTSREQTWDAESGQLRIKVEAEGDEVHLADRLVFPDPLRAADDQTVNDYWMTRTGATATAKVASTAMWQLISDQAGPTCQAARRVTGLTMGADPAVGLSRVWSGLFNDKGDDGVLDQLAAISNASGENLGLRITAAAGPSLTVDIVQPRDLTQAVRFSADLRNLVGYSYKEQAPTVTHALTAGQGDLHLRLRKLIVTGSALALSWGRQVWKYLDRRDTADVAELTKEGTDAVVEGDATVSLAVTLTDSQAATYGVDWGLGDRITIYVAPPGQGASIEVADVVREILLEVDDKGAEKITPAVGTPDATALPASPTQQRLADVGSSLAGLTARK